MEVKHNKSKANLTLSGKKVSPFESKPMLLNWYEKFRKIYLVNGYQLEDVNVTDSLLQPEGREIPTGKVVYLKKAYGEGIYYLLLHMNNGSVADHQRYNNICKSSLGFSKEYNVNINLLLIYNTRTARITDIIEKVFLNDLNILATSIDELQRNSKSLLLYEHNCETVCFDILFKDKFLY